MHIRISEGFEQKLEATLFEIDVRFSDESQKPIDLQKEWSKPGRTVGVVSGFAKGKEVRLTCKDFENGTLRVLVPCKLVLCESIVFNPNPGYRNGEIDPDRGDDRDWMPHKKQDAYIPGKPIKGVHGAAASNAYHLGFFAAITIEHGEGTILDLNGFRFSCHPDFALQQRFHALIELANQPFMAGQGPSDFGGELRSAKMVWIRNGTLGLSSHHGIHGNSMQDILISDVTFVDYEVAAISLNGGRRIVVRDCQLEGTRDKVPTLSTYSGGRFARVVAKEAVRRMPELDKVPNLTKAHKKSIDDAKMQLEPAVLKLSELLDTTFNRAKLGQGNSQLLKEIHCLFRNPHFIEPGSGREIFPAEANPYGIALHSRGVLVNSFLCNGSKMGGLEAIARAFECTDIKLERVNIAKTRGTVREVLALAAKDAATGKFNVISDSAGAVFRFFKNSTQLSSHLDGQPAEMTDDGAPCLTALGQVQIGIARLERALVAAGLKDRQRMLTKNIPAEIVAWADGNGSRIVPTNGKKNRWQLIRSADSCDVLLELELRSNGDFMHHVNKGAIGLFVQAVDGLQVNRVIVAGVENIGLPGSAYAGAYVGPSDGGHGNQQQQLGYSGCDARGIYIGACSNVCTDRIQSHGIVSRYGHATGIEFAGGTEHAEIHSAVVGNVAAGTGFQQDEPDEKAIAANPFFPPAVDFPSRYPNPEPQAVGLVVDSTTRNIAVEDFQVIGTIVQPGRRSAPKLRIEARLNNLSPGHHD